MSEFTPAELDALEDALEGLEESVPTADGAPGRTQAVVTRLDEYRAILQTSREALPMQDVPAGLLGGVLEQAKAAAAKPRPAPPPKQSWWKRFRGTLVLPAAALAGTAALLLVVIYPKGEDTAALEAGPATARTESKPEAAAAREQSPIELGRETQQLADAYKKEEAAGEFEADAARGKGMPGAVLEDADEAELQEESRAEKKAPARENGLLGGRTGADERTKSSSRSRDAKPKPKAPAKNKKADAPSDPFAEPEPEPAEPAQPTPAPKAGGADIPGGGGAGSTADDEDTSALRTAVDKGDAHRHARKCGLARLQYKKAQDAADPKIRARALAGLGLCERAEGNNAAAETYFTKAKAADPSIASFIDSELVKSRK